MASVAAGTGLWFVGLSYAVSLKHKKISERTLLLLERISGVALLVLAFIHGTRIIWQMARHRM